MRHDLAVSVSRVAAAAGVFLFHNACFGADTRRDIIDSHHGCVCADIVLAFFAAWRRNEGVVPSRHDEAGEDEEERDVADCEAENVERVFAQLVEGGVGEAIYNGENGCRDVAHEGTPEGWDTPVFALGHDYIEIAAELIALGQC